MDMYENELDDEREREKTMTIEIAGMNLEIPEEIIQERATCMCMDSLEENIQDIRESGEIFFRCFKPGELKTKEEYQNQLIDHLESELALYK